jgi:phage FluMu protein Com
MERATRCLHCGKRLVPVPKGNGRTELECIRCADPTLKDKGSKRRVAVPLNITA